MKQSNLLVWWRAFDALRKDLGLGPSTFATVHWYWRRHYLPWEAAQQDFRWLQGSPRLLGSAG